MVEEHSGYDLQGEVKIGGSSGEIGQVIKAQGPGNSPVFGYDDYGLSFIGIVTTATDITHFKASALAGFGDGYFVGYHVYVIWDAGGAGAAPQGEHKPISAYTSSDGTFAHTAFTVQLALTDKVLIVHPSIAEILDIHLDTQVRSITSTAGSITRGGSKYLHIDSDTNGAEILSVIIYGLIGGDWTINVYVPYADGAAACAAADKKDTWDVVNTDAETGLLKPTAIAYDMYIDFINTEAADAARDVYVTVVYRSRAALTLTWEA